MSRILIGLSVVVSMFAYILYGDVDSSKWSSAYYITIDLFLLYLINSFLKRGNSRSTKFIYKVLFGIFSYGAIVDVVSIISPVKFELINKSVECALLTTSVVLVLLITYLYERLVKR